MQLNLASIYLSNGISLLEDEKCQEGAYSLAEAGRFAFWEIAEHLKLHVHGWQGLLFQFTL